MKQKYPGNVLITSSPYTTLIYFLISDLERLKDTGYFFVRSTKYGPAERQHILNIMPCSYFFYNGLVRKRFTGSKIIYPIYRLIQLFFKRSIPYFWLYFTKYIRWPFLKTAAIWAYDDWSACRALIGRRKYTFLEEGTGSYIMPDTLVTKGKRSFPKRLASFMESPFGFRTLATTPQAEKIILTGMAKIPECWSTRKKDIEIISMQCLWDRSSDEKKDFIMKMFDFEPEDAEELRKRDIIFIEQCFFDEDRITFDENTEMLRKIFSHYDHSRIIIKTHYRSTVNYRKIFPDIFVIDKPIPMELIALCGERFTKAITINSTAVLQFPEDVEIEWLASDLNSEYFSHFSDKSRKWFEESRSQSVTPYRISSQKNRKVN